MMLPGNPIYKELQIAFGLVVQELLVVIAVLALQLIHLRNDFFIRTLFIRTGAEKSRMS